VDVHRDFCATGRVGQGGSPQIPNRCARSLKAWDHRIKLRRGDEQCAGDRADPRAARCAGRARASAQGAGARGGDGRDIRGFARRTAAKRGRHVATAAVARKLAVLAWQLLTRCEDSFGIRSTDRRSAVALPSILSVFARAWPIARTCLACASTTSPSYGSRILAIANALPVASMTTRSSRELCANSSSCSGVVAIRPAARARPQSAIATWQKSALHA
jgi:hypothetical protein